MEQGAQRVDYTEAVYGSLLAASVVVGEGARPVPLPAGTLMIVLLATGLVFWLAHVYSRVAGAREPGTAIGWSQVRAAGLAERPLIVAAVPPALMAGTGWLIGLSDGTTVMLCLLVAIGGQVGWAVTAAVRSGATTREVILSGAVNLALGLAIISLKTALTH